MRSFQHLGRLGCRGECVASVKKHWGANISGLERVWKVPLESKAILNRPSGRLLLQAKLFRRLDLTRRITDH
jgi:hypothetical protein